MHAPWPTLPPCVKLLYSCVAGVHWRGGHRAVRLHPRLLPLEAAHLSRGIWRDGWALRHAAWQLPRVRGKSQNCFPCYNYFSFNFLASSLILLCPNKGTGPACTGPDPAWTYLTARHRGHLCSILATPISGSKPDLARLKHGNETDLSKHPQHSTPHHVHHPWWPPPAPRTGVLHSSCSVSHQTYLLFS